MKLYHYVHCPFCIRVRMVLGFLGIKFESIVVPYNDEKTPIDLCGKKMLPIMKFEDIAQNESLEIIKRLDSDNLLKTTESINNYSSLEKLLNELGENIHSLAMPYFIWTPEFNQEARAYFQTKKELKRGPFKDLVRNREEYEEKLKKTLNNIKDHFEKVVTKDTLLLDDILIASHLWAMYLVPEFQFEPKVHNYLQGVKAACDFEYHRDFWS